MLQVLAVGRRMDRLETTRAAYPDLITPLCADVGTSVGQRDIVAGIPASEPLKFLVHNAAVGEPARMGEIDGEIGRHGRWIAIQFQDLCPLTKLNMNMYMITLLNCFSVEAFTYAMAVNVVGPLALTQGFLPRLKKNHGRIVHLGTGESSFPALRLFSGSSYIWHGTEYCC